MKLDAVSMPRIMLQAGFCAALVAGTYLMAQERPKDSARLLTEVEEAQFTLGTKGDRMIVAAHQPADESKPVEVAMAPDAEKPGATPTTPATAPKPKRVTVAAPPAAVEHREIPPPPAVAGPAPASPAWTAQPGSAQPTTMHPAAGQATGVQPGTLPPPSLAARPVVPPPPAPQPKPQETTFLGLPPMPTPQEFIDNTVKETNAAFGKMKQAMEDAFR